MQLPGEASIAEEVHHVSTVEAILSWLPSKLPANCRVLLSAASETTAAKALAARDLKVFEVPELSSSEKEKAITKYLEVFQKTLEPGHLQVHMSPH